MKILATDPATPAQIGAIHGEFRRLGFTRGQRAERLAAAAAIAGRAELASSAVLTAGEAGQLLRLLRGCDTRAELAELADVAERGDFSAEAWPEPSAEWPRIFGQLLRAICRRIEESSIGSRAGADNDRN